MGIRVKFKYKNHRGEIAERDVDIENLEFHSNPGYDYTPGWYVSGWDYVKQGRRSFSLSRIMLSPEDLQGPFGTNQIFRLLTIPTGNPTPEK